MLWYCKYKWHPNTTVEALRKRILEQDAAGTNQPKRIRGWYDLAGNAPAIHGLAQLGCACTHRATVL